MVALPLDPPLDDGVRGEDTVGATPLDDGAGDVVGFELREEDMLALRLSEGEAVDETVDDWVAESFADALADAVVEGDNEAGHVGWNENPVVGQPEAPPQQGEGAVEPCRQKNPMGHALIEPPKQKDPLGQGTVGVSARIFELPTSLR
jgi:hypothetical protein